MKPKNENAGSGYGRRLARLLGASILVLSFVWRLESMAADDPATDDPPARLKRKPKPMNEEPEKKKEMEKEKEPEKKITDKLPPPPTRKEDGDDEPILAPEKDSKEIVARVSKNMRASGERLSKNDSGEATRQVQLDILKDLDALIEKNQQQQGGGSSSSSRKEKKPEPSNQKPKPNPSAQKDKTGKDQQPKPDKDPRDSKGGQSQDENSRLADLYKDVWGHLPAEWRQEMDTYAREQFMLKYSDLLKQYYSTIAEKSQKRGDRQE